MEKTKLSLLSRTLFKDEAERKSQNLPEIFNPPSQEVKQTSIIENNKQQPKAAPKRPTLFRPKAARPRLAGLPFGFKPASSKVKEPKESFDISKFSRKGNTKFLPPRLKYFGARQEEEATSEKATTTSEKATTTTEESQSTLEDTMTSTIGQPEETSMGEGSQETTLEEEPQESTLEMTTKRMTTMDIMETSVTTNTMSSKKVRAKGRGNGAVRRRKPISQVVTTATPRIADTEMTELTEPVTNTSHQDLEVSETEDDMTTKHDDHIDIDDSVTPTQETTLTTSTTSTIPPTAPEALSTTISNIASSMMPDGQRSHGPVRSGLRGRVRTRGRLGIGERRKIPHGGDNFKNSVEHSESESSKRSRIRGRGKPRKPQVVVAEEKKNHNLKSIRGKTSVMEEGKLSEDDSNLEEKKGQAPRLRGRNRGSHRFMARTSVRDQHVSLEEEDRAAVPTFRGSRRRLGDIPSLKENEVITSEGDQVRMKEKEKSASQFSEEEITTLSSTITSEASTENAFSKKESNSIEQKSDARKLNGRRISGRLRGRLITKKTVEKPKKEAIKKVTGRRSGLRSSRIRSRHKSTKSSEPINESVHSSENMDIGETKGTKGLSLRSRSSRRQSPNSIRNRFVGKRKEQEAKKVQSKRGRGRGRGRFSQKLANTIATTITTTTTREISQSTTASTIISTFSTSSQTTTTASPTSTSNTNEENVELPFDNSDTRGESFAQPEKLGENTMTTSLASDVTEYHFFPAETDRSKEKYKLQQETAAEKETQVEADHDNTDTDEDDEEDLSQHLNSALNLATVTWTQVICMSGTK